MTTKLARDLTAFKPIGLPDLSFRRRRYSRIIPYLILGATLAIYALQLRSLYIVPVYDSVKWGGDETWLMREFGNQAAHGAMSYPESFGGIARTDGVLAGSMWFDALVYGATGNHFSPKHDLISVGRTVTTLLGLVLIISLFLILRKLRVDPILAAGAVALLVIDQGFVWVSHSSRYDLLTGLTLIAYCYYASAVAARGVVSTTASLLFGIACVGVIIFSRHSLTLTFSVTLLTLWTIRIWKHRGALAAWFAGVVSSAGILALAYWRGAGEFSLFGRGGNSGSFSFVIGQIPILRPFSRNVQVSNVMERIDLFAADIPGLLLLGSIAAIMFIGYKMWQRFLLGKGTRLKIATSPEQRFFLRAAVPCAMSWLLLQGSRPYYLFHIVPLLIIASCIILQLWMDVYQGRWMGPVFAGAVLVAALMLDIPRALPATTLGEAVSNDQKTSVDRLLALTPENAKPKTRILLDVAGLDWGLVDTSREVLTLDMFQPPADASLAAAKLRANHIDYVILRSSPVSALFEPGRALLPHVLDSMGELRDSALGFFYDDGRSYDASLSTLIRQGLDTLKLYRVER